MPAPQRDLLTNGCTVQTLAWRVYFEPFLQRRGLIMTSLKFQKEHDIINSTLNPGFKGV